MNNVLRSMIHRLLNFRNDLFGLKSIIGMLWLGLYLDSQAIPTSIAHFLLPAFIRAYK